MRFSLLHRDVEFDLNRITTGNLVILLFTSYRSFDTRITVKKTQICREFSMTNTVTWFTCNSMHATYRLKISLFNSSLSSFSMSFHNIRVFYSSCDESTYPL